MTPAHPIVVAAFDAIVARHLNGRVSFTEEEALDPAFWSRGDDAALREDLRFRETPWGRWMLSAHRLANEVVYDELAQAGGADAGLDDLLGAWDKRAGRRHVVCAGDPRLVVSRGRVRLAASELSDRPRLVEATALERFVTHLPVYSLRAVAASMPDDGWGARALEELPGVIGWVRVDLPGNPNRRDLFIARVVGHSMDDARSGLRDGRYAVFTVATPALDEGPIVLVRGAFHDPETGTYAVKRLRQRRSEDSASVETELESLNPDRVRYPVITLDPTRAEAVRVVAGLVSPLDRLEHARATRARTPAGVRDLDSVQARAELHEDLAKRLDDLFGGPGEDASDEPAGDDTGLPWRARLELTDEGLHLALSPLVGLASDVTWLDVDGGRPKASVRASTARVHPSRVPLVPQVAAYVVGAEGAGPELAASLKRLETPGLSETKGTVFTAGAGSSWRRVTSTSVGAGRTVRVVVPPSLAAVDVSGFEPQSLGAGWQVVEITLPEAVPVTMRATLEALGLDAAAFSLMVRVVGAIPRRVEETAGGTSVPVWRRGDSVDLQVASSALLDAGRASLFLLGPGGLQATALTSGQRWTFRLTGLTSGRYLVRALAVSTAVPPEELVFEVRDEVEPHRAEARWEVTLDGHPVAAEEAEHDFSAWVDPWPLGIVAPPQWEICGRWRTAVETPLPTIHADELRAIELAPWRAMLAGLLAHERAGSLLIDAGLLGRTTIRHRAAPGAASVRRALVACWEPVADFLAAGNEHPAAWFDHWFRPALTALGYLMGPQPDVMLSGEDLAIARLRRAADPHEGGWLIAITAPDRFGDSKLRTYAVSVRNREKADGLILSDGVRWCLYDVHRRRWPGSISLPTALLSDEAFQTFFDGIDAG